MEMAEKYFKSFSNKNYTLFHIMYIYENATFACKLLCYDKFTLIQVYRTYAGVSVARLVFAKIFLPGTFWPKIIHYLVW